MTYKIKEHLLFSYLCIFGLFILSSIGLMFYIQDNKKTYKVTIEQQSEVIIFVRSVWESLKVKLEELKMYFTYY